MDATEWPPKYREAAPPPEESYWDRRAETMSPQERGVRRPAQAAPPAALRLRQLGFLQGAVARRRGRSRRRPEHRRPAPSSDPHQGRPAPRAGGPPSVRPVPVHPAGAHHASPGHLGDHGSPHHLRDRTRGLGADRRRSRPHPLGGGATARGHRHHRRRLQRLHRQLGRSPGSRAAGRQVLPVRGRSAPADGARRRLDRHAEAHRPIRHPLLRPLPGVHREADGRRPAQGLQLPAHVLLGRAGREHPVDAKGDRGHFRMLRRGPGKHGRDDAMDDQLRLPVHEAGDAPVDGYRLHGDRRPRDARPGSTGRRGCPRLHASGAHLPAHDPLLVGRPGQMDRRRMRVRQDLPHSAGGVGPAGSTTW